MKKEKDVERFKKLLKFSGTFNIIAAFMFITPKVYEYYLIFLNQINQKLGLGGVNISIPNDSFHALFINTAGIDLVLIGTIVLIISNSPLNKISRNIIFANGIGRSFFTVFVTYYYLYYDLVGIFMLFGIIDLFITVGFMFYLHKTKKYMDIDN